MLTVALLLIAPQATSAKPLSSEECAKFAAEHAKLAKKGLEKAMDQDPDKAKAQLEPQQIADIERFLFVEGEIRFRCPEIKLAIPDPPEPVKDKAAEKEKKKAEKPSGPQVPLPQRKPKRPTRRAG